MGNPAWLPLSRFFRAIVNRIMFTNCPQCHRQFRIRATQLSVADGQVKCGYCGQQFNAIERLHDKPLAPQKQPVAVVQARKELDQEPQFDIPGSNETTVETVTPEPPPEQDSLSTEVPEFETELETKHGPDVEQTALSGQQAQASAYMFSEDLLDDKPSGSGFVNRVLWALSTLLVAVVLVAQLVWFNRDALISRYPEMLPWLQDICARWHCEPIRYRNVSAIKLINRDVRDHPRYKQALLVNATMANQAHRTQPFPVVQLILYNDNGRLIAHRQFNPVDYLDRSIDINRGMQPDVSVHFVLEVIDPTEDAVSFEFKFL